VLFKHQPGEKGKQLVDFLRWVTHAGQELLLPLGYAKLPADLVKKIDDKLKTVTH
jgi:ABC-type phosphate transport system substrate-binding protein